MRPEPLGTPSCGRQMERRKTLSSGRVRHSVLAPRSEWAAPPECGLDGLGPHPLSFLGSAASRGAVRADVAWSGAGCQRETLASVQVLPVLPPAEALVAGHTTHYPQPLSTLCVPSAHPTVFCQAWSLRSHTLPQSAAAQSVWLMFCFFHEANPAGHTGSLRSQAVGRAWPHW